MRLTVGTTQGVRCAAGSATGWPTGPSWCRWTWCPPGSTEARQQFPGLDHARTMAEITVVADDGRVWTGEHAWVVALWATVSYRPLSLTLSGPVGLPLARAAAVAAAGLRSLTTSTP